MTKSLLKNKFLDVVWDRFQADYPERACNILNYMNKNEQP